MKTNLFLQQLAQRMDGDRRAMSQARDILRSMIDRKLWKQMKSAIEIPSDIGQVETLLDRYNIFFRYITLTDRWWSRCTGYMMGFMADDGTPVILEPGFTDYTFTHPKTGQFMMASKSSGLLKQEALIACLPFTDEKLTVRSIMRYAFSCLCIYDLLMVQDVASGVFMVQGVAPGALCSPGCSSGCSSGCPHGPECSLGYDLRSRV